MAPKPNIPHLKAFSKKQSLVVTLPARHTDGESDIYEIQIGRTETQSIIYSVSAEKFNNLDNTVMFVCN